MADMGPEAVRAEMLCGQLFHKLVKM